MSQDAVIEVFPGHAAQQLSVAGPYVSRCAGKEQCATRCGTPTPKTSLSESGAAVEDSPRNEELRREIIGKHYEITATAARLVVLACDVGHKLKSLKELNSGLGQWGLQLAKIAAECGMSERTAQLYMQIASNWELIKRAHGSLEQLTLRGVQAFLGQNSKQARRAAEILSTELSDAIAAFFPGGVELNPCCSSHNASLIAAQVTYSRRSGIDAANPWKGSVFAYPRGDDQIKSIVRRAVAEFSTESIEQTLLIVPANLNAPWIDLLDGYPRVYLRDDVLSYASRAQHRLMLVGLLPKEHTHSFCVTFRGLGAMFLPVSFWDQYPR